MTDPSLDSNQQPRARRPLPPIPIQQPTRKPLHPLPHYPVPPSTRPQTQRSDEITDDYRKAAQRAITLETRYPSSSPSSPPSSRSADPSTSSAQIESNYIPSLLAVKDYGSPSSNIGASPVSLPSKAKRWIRGPARRAPPNTPTSDGWLPDDGVEANDSMSDMKQLLGAIMDEETNTSPPEAAMSDFGTLSGPSSTGPTTPRISDPAWSVYTGDEESFLHSLDDRTGLQEQDRRKLGEGESVLELGPHTHQRRVIDGDAAFSVGSDQTSDDGLKRSGGRMSLGHEIRAFRKDGW